MPVIQLPVPVPVIELTEPYLGYEPRHLSDANLSAKIRTVEPGGLEQMTLLREQARRRDVRLRAAAARG